MPKKIDIYQEDLKCPNCQTEHKDVDLWALRPHKTHLCLNCNRMFEGTLKGVSRPTFERRVKPENVNYIPFQFNIPF